VERNGWTILLVVPVSTLYVLSSPCMNVVSHKELASIPGGVRSVHSLVIDVKVWSTIVDSQREASTNG
jgi:hypothetical protein